MKKQLINFTSFILLSSFLVNFVPIPNETDCVENKCDAMETMSCCNMDKIEMAGCACPEMSEQEKQKPEESPAATTAIISKLVFKVNLIIIKESALNNPLERIFDNLVSSDYSFQNNKIYKRINSFLI